MGEIIDGILYNILPIKNAEAIIDSMIAFPDMAVKFVDALEKSKNSNFAYSEMAEAAGALIALVVAASNLIGKASPIYNIGSVVLQLAFLANDLADPNSPIHKLADTIWNGVIEPLSITGDEGNDIIEGGKLGDTLNGMGGDDTIHGGCGKDSISGGAGNDILDGGACDDTIDGGAGNDVIIGGAGKDILVGGMGKDILTGGAGADKFVISISDVLDGQDTIKDFKHGVDKIVLDGFSFNAQNFKDVTAGNQVRELDDYILYNSSTGNLFYDTDGWDHANGRENGAGAKLIAHFDGNPTVTYSDFVFSKTLTDPKQNDNHNDPTA